MLVGTALLASLAQDRLMQTAPTTEEYALGCCENVAPAVITMGAQVGGQRSGWDAQVDGKGLATWWDGGDVPQ